MQRVAQRSRYSNGLPCIGLQILIFVLLMLIVDISSTEGGIVETNSLEGRCMLNIVLLQHFPIFFM